MKLATIAIVLGATASSAAARPLLPLTTLFGRPAVGNIGQRGKPADLAVQRPQTPKPTAQKPAPQRMDAGMRPLLNEQKRPAAGNCMKKGCS